MDRDEQVFQNLANSEAIQERILGWLFQLSEPDSIPQMEELTSPETPPGADFTNRLAQNNLDPLDSEPIERSPSIEGDLEAGFSELDEGVSLNPEQSLKPGEIPAVQDRFYTLVKRRLETEIQHHPPLFPWENELLDYEPDYLDFPEEKKVPAFDWLTQLPLLSLPVTLPATVLTQLLEECRVLIQSSLQDGAKLVRAVEGLFPDRRPQLHQLAGWALAMSPTRGSSAEALNPLASGSVDFPPTYEGASTDQQMVLCLLAAREIMGTLTLSVSASGGPVERQWLTSAGMLSIRVESVGKPNHDPSKETQSLGCLRVRGELPSGGTLQLRGGEAQSTTSRPNAGCLHVELFEPQPDCSYLLEVRFHNEYHNTLTFVVRLS
ncbi:hypothetical protein [Oscillatoria sp. HE19RPO]|uniref:hypothetical protein n=1 Tax=Oscillatoria sp. HE19RPO TaxID=2954806 RepID=UPI0020C3326F|nr:hypothetical protein [Oscillatoria sp. HE19RPO]